MASREQRKADDYAHEHGIQRSFGGYQAGKALLNIAVSITACIAAAALGIFAARQL